MTYISNTPDERAAMLDAIGVGGVGELFADIPESLRAKQFDLPDGMSEMQVRNHLHRLGEKTFQRKYGLDLDMIAQVITCRWQEMHYVG